MITKLKFLLLISFLSTLGYAQAKADDCESCELCIDPTLIYLRGEWGM